MDLNDYGKIAFAKSIIDYLLQLHWEGPDNSSNSKVLKHQPQQILVEKENDSVIDCVEKSEIDWSWNFLDVCRQTFHISHVRKSKKLKDVLM